MLFSVRIFYPFTMNLQFRDRFRSILLGALMGLILAVVFAAGFFARDWLDRALFAGPAVGAYPLLDEVDGFLQRYYLRELPQETQRQYAAIRGLMESLGDRNTFFIEPVVAQNESDALAGTYGGIGVQVLRSTEGQYVLYPFEDSPAAKNNILEGDILLAVNDIQVDGSTPQDNIDRSLRGTVENGNGVEITVQTPGEAERTLFIEFGVINVPSVIWRLLPEDTRLGYVRILRFTNRTPDELVQALTELNNSEIESLILDLRDNGGGLLQESVTVASQFLDGGVVVYERNIQGEKTFTAEPGGLSTDIPLVVLVNGGTASASELVAGAILDRDRGIVIGQKTYGKGTIQQIFQLSDTSSIHVTSAEWFTPSKRALDNVGIEPTIPVVPDESGRDLELVEAIKYLQQQLLPIAETAAS
jgi:carboxyl-terminal processing protease